MFGTCVGKCVECGVVREMVCGMVCAMVVSRNMSVCGMVCGASAVWRGVCRSVSLMWSVCLQSKLARASTAPRPKTR